MSYFANVLEELEPIICIYTVYSHVLPDFSPSPKQTSECLFQQERKLILLRRQDKQNFYLEYWWCFIVTIQDPQYFASIGIYQPTLADSLYRNFLGLWIHLATYRPSQPSVFMLHWTLLALSPALKLSISIPLTVHLRVALGLDGRGLGLDDVRLPTYRPSPVVRHHITMGLDGRGLEFDDMRLPTYRPPPPPVGNHITLGLDGRVPGFDAWPGWACPQVWWCAPSHLPSIPRCPSPCHTGPGWAWIRVWWCTPRPAAEYQVVEHPNNLISRIIQIYIVSIIHVEVF